MTSEYEVNVDSIEIVLPVIDHSNRPPDQVFATTEKEMQQYDTILLPEDYLKIICRFSTV